MTTLHPGVVAILLSSFIFWILVRPRQRYPEPPGPKGWPIIKNLLEMPTSGLWLKAAEWRKEYGDVVFVRALGRSYLFINSYEAAMELLEKRSLKSSSRPQTAMASLQRWDWFITFMPYGETWRKHSAYLHRFGTQSAPYYYNIHAKHAHKLLRNFLKEPGGFFDHIEGYFGATIMMIAYGHETEVKDDPFVALAKKAILQVANAFTPGKFLVDIIPWLKYIPPWMPGTRFHEIAREGRALGRAVRYLPYEMTKEKISKGTAIPSMTSILIEENTGEDGKIKDEDVIVNVTGGLYLAGVDTSVVTIQIFMLAMLLNSEVQQRAQREIDNVVGNDRLPSIADRQDLPYLVAIIDEVLRWEPVVPIGVLHAQTEDDVYNGSLIPQGTTLVANLWCILHDEDVYPDPLAFKPERFLSSGGGDSTIRPRDPKKISFGFGRRTCPGQQVALDAMYIAFSNILACFDIKPEIGEDGLPVDLRVDVASQFITSNSMIEPIPFKCSIVPRSPKHRELIEQLADFAC